MTVAELKPYEVYKDSGVPWLGEVPEHWVIRRGKYLFSCIDERSETGDEELLTVSSERGIVPRKSANVTMFQASSYVGHKLCWPGDLVINSLWAWARGLGVSKNHGIVSTAYGVYRINSNSDCNSQFIHELVRSTPFQWELQVRSKGVWISRLQLTDESFLGAPFPKPPFSEQAAIVRYLEYMDRRIRRYIRAKQKLIKLLEEQKQAIIHRAVTRGLDSDVPLKPSGVEWLGDIPEHWPILRTKLLLKQVVSDIPPEAKMVTCFRDGQVTLRSNRRIEGFTNAIKELGYQGIKPGQLVLHSMDAFAGAIGISDSSGKCSPEYVICEPATSGVHLEYYGALLRSLAIRGLFVWLCPSVRERAPRVRFSHFGAFSITQPPLEEQEAIMNEIKSACSMLDATLERSRRELELLSEYRTRLIADVVTGKLDVREAAANLPDESDEEELSEQISELEGGDKILEDLESEPTEEVEV
ncbi:MAG: restriction endonuclease subunit S [Candidatus Margulisiibacteriota bacterium]